MSPFPSKKVKITSSHSSLDMSSWDRESSQQTHGFVNGEEGREVNRLVESIISPSHDI